MACSKPKTDTPTIRADIKLLNFNDYDDFMLSLSTDQDRCFLDSEEVAKQFGMLGYRGVDKPMTREEFDKRVAAVEEYLNPTHRPFEMASDNLPADADPVLVELSLRERANRVGILSTIIFLRSTLNGVEISGYIDYAHRLVSENWKSIFKGMKKLKVTVSDLGYYNWQKGKVISNNSLFYRVKNSKKYGLMFQHVYDRLIITVDPKCSPGENTQRKTVKSDLFDQVCLLDHVVRQRI